MEHSFLFHVTGPNDICSSTLSRASAKAHLTDEEFGMMERRAVSGQYSRRSFKSARRMHRRDKGLRPASGTQVLMALAECGGTSASRQLSALRPPGSVARPFALAE